MTFDIENIFIFLLILPFVSFFYASVGHGGASGYLALMALFSVTPELMKPTALLLNLFVAALAFYYYYKEGYFNKKLFLYFAIASIPMSIIGGYIEVDATIYKKILAVLLLFAILKMLNIGFFSGLIGIGGGIILSPIILLFHWGKMKEAAAVSALFIWVNSAGGLLGQLSSGVSLNIESFGLVAIALIGGFFGAYYGSKKMNNQSLRYLLAMVLVIACIKLFYV
jgi:uncharacterized membrane protein YfcA